MRLSIGCGLLTLIVCFVLLTGFLAYASVFSYYAEYEQRDHQAETAITNELWLQELLHHPFAPACYTLDTALCATAEQVRAYPLKGKDDFWFNWGISAVPAIFVAGLAWLIVWLRRRRRGALAASA